jgi:hypothetical protein
MNNLHLEYLRDTGKQPITNLYDILRDVMCDNKQLSDDEREVISEYLYTIPDAYLNAHTPEYVQWLEDKLNDKL